jgi:hypothetical protein
MQAVGRFLGEVAEALKASRGLGMSCLGPLSFQFSLPSSLKTLMAANFMHLGGAKTDKTDKTSPLPLRNPKSRGGVR